MLGEMEDLEFTPSSHRGMTPRIFEFLFARMRAVSIISVVTVSWSTNSFELSISSIYPDITGRGKPK